MKIATAIFGAGLALSLASQAHASITLNVSETFQSGATFTGTVTAADGFTSITGVDGTLTDYNYGTSGYTGTGSDPIDWIWDPGANFDTNSATTFGTFLMDGPVDDYIDYYNFITFDIDYTNPNHIVFDIGSNIFSETDGGNNVSTVDPLVSGTISAVPEPATWAMMLLGFAGLGFVGYCKTRNHVADAAPLPAFIRTRKLR